MELCLAHVLPQASTIMNESKSKVATILISVLLIDLMYCIDLVEWF